MSAMPAPLRTASRPMVSPHHGRGPLVRRITMAATRAAIAKTIGESRMTPRIGAKISWAKINIVVRQFVDSYDTTRGRRAKDVHGALGIFARKELESCRHELILPKRPPK